MIKPFVILILISIFFFKPVFSQDLSKEQLNSDLKYYADSFSAKHKNPFTKISKDGFAKRVEQIAQKPSLTTNEFIIELMKVNAAVGDEHSNVFPSFTTTFPFEFEIFDDGIMIISTDSANQKYLGHKLLGIDNTPVTEINTRYKTIIKQDNPSFFKVFQAFYLNKPNILDGLKIIDNEVYAHFTLLSPEGDTVKAKISTIPVNQNLKWITALQTKKLLAYEEKTNYWYRFDRQTSVLYFNYMRCAEMKDKPFKDFNNELFNVIRNEKPSKIVLDLRFNSGGNSAVLQPFIDSIKHSKLNKKNKFFILIGKKVFSSSLMNAVELKRNTKAKLIGQETAGSINHFGELRSMRLPNTKLTVTYSTKYWETWKNHDGPLKPDAEVPNSYIDFLKSQDKVLQKAIEK